MGIIFAFAVVALSLLLAGAWGVQRVTGQSGWVDTLWTLSVGLVGAAAALAPINGALPVAWPAPRQIFVAGLALLWALRLASALARRTLLGGEDPRYQALRDEWGPDEARRLFWFLQAQAAAGFVLVIAIVLAARNGSPFPAWSDILAALVFALGIAGGGLADAQMAAFKASRPAGVKICETGLWRYSRHPNYFFEWLIWMSYPIIAIGYPDPSAIGLIALIAPAFMYFLLVHVSGIPPLEAHMQRSRGAAFAAYQRRVNAFFPGRRRDG